MLGGQHRCLLAAKDGDVVRRPHFDEVERVNGRRRLDPVGPALEAEGTVVINVDAGPHVPIVPRIRPEADGGALEVQLEPGRLRRRRAEARQHLTDGAALELEVDQHVIGRRDVDRATGEGSSTNDSRWKPDRSHRLHAADGAHQHRQAVEAVDAVVDEWAHAAPVEHGWVPGVLTPSRRSRIGVMGDGEREPAESVGGNDLGQPPESPRHGHGGSAEQMATALPRELDELVRLGQR